MRGGCEGIDRLPSSAARYDCVRAMNRIRDHFDGKSIVPDGPVGERAEIEAGKQAGKDKRVRRRADSIFVQEYPPTPPASKGLSKKDLDRIRRSRKALAPVKSIAVPKR